MELPIYQVAAFTEAPFGGNPAAVVPLSAWIDDSLMQKIAAENNLSETAFLVPVADGGESPKWFAGQPAEVIDAIGEYLNRRRVWGLFLPPDEVARAVFDHAPRLNKVRLQVAETVMDTRTARLGERTHQYFYELDRSRDLLRRYPGPEPE